MISEGEAAVARAVLIHGPLSRSALATKLRLSPASLTRLARPLVDAGILIELADDERSVGRPSRPLDISPTAGTFVGVKLTGDRLYLVASDIRADPIESFDRPLPSTEPQAVQDAIVAAVREIDRDDIRGLGVSVGGFMADGTVVDAPFLGWRDVPLAHSLGERLGVPVTLENDVVALAEAERWFGVGRGIPGFCVITIGAGVGFGLVIDGQAVRTHDATVGTGGHLPLSSSGPTCPDGHRGCARAMLTSDSLVEQVSTGLGRPIDIAEVWELARAGEPVSRAVVDAAGDALGTLCALAANLSLQSDIVLSGEGVALYDLVRGRVAAALARDRASMAAPISVHVDRAGFPAWARGAAAVAIQAAMGRITLDG